MNGVAREFWSEVFDLRSAAQEPVSGRDRTRKGRVRRKVSKKTQANRTRRSAA